MSCHPEQPFTPVQEARIREIFREEMTAHIARSNAAGDKLLAGLKKRRARALAVPTSKTDGSPRNVLGNLAGGPLCHAATANSTLVEQASEINVQEFGR